MSGFFPNRWLILAAVVVINMCAGSAYAWSVLQKPLQELFHWSTQETTMAFTISLAMLPLAMIIGGKIQDHIGPRRVIACGALFYGAGIIGAGFSTSLVAMYLTYGVWGGIGLGSIMACTIANTVKFFPGRRGMASGLIAAGFGLGAVVLAPVSAALVEEYGILTTFKILGTTYMTVILACTALVRTAPPDYRPVNWFPHSSAAVAVRRGADKNWREVLSDPVFYLLWGMFGIAAVAGLMVIGHASPIGQEVVGLDSRTAALAVSLLAIGNTSGRVIWGWISDQLGRYNTVMIVFVLTAMVMAAMPQIRSTLPFLAAITMIGLCYGGIVGIFPSIVADRFGTKHMGINYGLINTAYGVGAYAGPRLASHFKETNHGDYTLAFIAAAGLCVLGLLLTLAARQQIRKDLACTKSSPALP